MVTVKEIQARLKVLGYYKYAVDGINGPYTIAAIKAFQKAKGLLQDGIVGPITLKALGLTDDGKLVMISPYTMDRQDTGYTCGPSSLKIALSHYGINIYEMTLAFYAGSSTISGSTHQGLINAVQRVNRGLILDDKTFTSVGWSGVRDYIKAGIPIIAHIESFINAGKSGHYLVIVGIDNNNKTVTLADPSYGTRVVSFATMEYKMKWILNTGRASTNLMPLRKI